MALFGLECGARMGPRKCSAITSAVALLCAPRAGTFRRRGTAASSMDFSLSSDRRCSMFACPARQHPASAWPHARSYGSTMKRLDEQTLARARLLSLLMRTPDEHLGVFANRAGLQNSVTAEQAGLARDVLDALAHALETGNAG